MKTAMNLLKPAFKRVFVARTPKTTTLQSVIDHAEHSLFIGLKDTEEGVFLYVDFGILDEVRFTDEFDTFSEGLVEIERLVAIMGLDTTGTQHSTETLLQPQWSVVSPEEQRRWDARWEANKVAWEDAKCLAQRAIASDPKDAHKHLVYSALGEYLWVADPADGSMDQTEYFRVDNPAEDPYNLGMVLLRGVYTVEDSTGWESSFSSAEEGFEAMRSRAAERGFVIHGLPTGDVSDNNSPLGG